MEGGVAYGVWDGRSGMVLVPIWMVRGQVCVERVLIAGTVTLGKHVVEGKEGRPNKLGV